MVRTIIALLFCFPVALYAQTYQQLSERAIDCISSCCFTSSARRQKRGGNSH